MAPGLVFLTPCADDGLFLFGEAVEIGVVGAVACVLAEVGLLLLLVAEVVFDAVLIDLEVGLSTT